MSQDLNIVVVGAGHAGGTAAALLRQYGHTGAVTLVGDEPIPPYQRPPLSKAWLKGEADAESLALKPAEFYPEAGITFRPSERVVEILREAKAVQLATGEQIPYDALILATGARPIRLPVPGATLEGIHLLRSAADAERLKAELGLGRRIAIIGGGYIGLEVAASSVALGGSAVVLEREPRLLARSGSPVVAEFFRAYHEAHGVEVRLGVTVTGFEANSGRVGGVLLDNGQRVDCDLALMGVGVTPNQELAMNAGLECARGVVVTLEARTSDPSIFAIGDVSHRPLPHYDRMFALESVPNALEQAKQVACALTARPAPPPEVTWNWSDQYDVKLQLAGLPFDIDEVVVRGDVAAAKFAVFHLRDRMVQQVEAVNSPGEFMIGKQLIQARSQVDPARLGDLSVSMKEVAGVLRPAPA